MAVLVRSASQLFNLSTKRAVLCSSNVESKRLLHIARWLLAERKYTEKHEWISVENGIGTVGVTDYAQEKLGDIVYVELPNVGDTVSKGEEFGALESVKAAADIYSPVDGEVSDINSNLSGEPELVNKSPYDEGWLIKIQLSASLSDYKGLLSEEQYQQLIKDEDE
ncbi:hypothetical protein OS493_007793 [Desmophyllum pertusum]|uniref:Glycine cleavage system H protein n=1 Tax=Desmophyllum pertusum TaxID=174260 RepID=A0A9X0CP22_9CNID|nr:hypothetical protein OS493_007793 [Desmophyllum pertusum]